MTVCKKRWKPNCAAVLTERPGGRRTAPLPVALRLLLSLFSLSSLAAAQPRPGVSPDVYAAKAYEHFYSLELDESIEMYRKAIELEPANPLHWYGIADANLFLHLLRAGRLDSRLYSATNEFLTAAIPEPDAASVKAMWDALARARSICSRRLAENARDVPALYAMGLSYAVEANYHFSMTRKYFEALSAGSRAKDYHEQILAIEPGNHDAKLLVGINSYAVGSIPASVRWIVYLAGYSGSKERGVALIHDAMQYGKRTSPAALTVLGLIYNREKMYAYSREMLGHLMRFFPRNFLFEMEVASSFRKENNLPAAIETYRSVARKLEQGAPGYHRASAVKLYFQIGALMEESRRPAEALAYYEKLAKTQAVATGASPQQRRETGSPLVGHGYLRMGEIHLAAGRREQARAMFETARRMPFPEIQRKADARLRVM